MPATEINRKNTIRKLIDLDKEAVKRLQIQAIEKDYGSVKEYIEALLTRQAQQKQTA